MVWDFYALPEKRGWSYGVRGLGRGVTFVSVFVVVVVVDVGEGDLWLSSSSATSTLSHNKKNTF